MMITLRRAYVWSLVAHCVFALVLSRMHLRAEARRSQEILRARAVEHAPVFRRKAAELHAEQTRRMRELIEKLARKEREGVPPKTDTAKQSPEAPPTSSHAAQPEDTRAERPDAVELWRRTREDYAAAREQYLKQKSERLEELRAIDPKTARRMVEEAAGQGAAGGAPPATDKEAAEQIARMNSETRQMLAEARLLIDGRTQGSTVQTDAGREAFWLTQTQENGHETLGFDESVDWSVLMRNGQNSGPINARIDSPDELRRVDRADAARLRADLQRSGERFAFTRRLGGAEATQATWVCPDRWYVIGPFPNPNREAIDRTYPPELEIDRDAVYEGLDGRPVSWVLTKPYRHIVIPRDMVEYGIYYGYTEIHCAEAMDCWLALGSDDHSKLWVNDRLVWSSSKNLKTRNTAEGFRKIHFAKGVNRLLFRLENGWNGAEFSLLISLK